MGPVMNELIEITNADDLESGLWRCRGRSLAGGWLPYARNRSLPERDGTVAFRSVRHEHRCAIPSILVNYATKPGVSASGRGRPVNFTEAAK
jgi:hypothetical protein